MMFLPFPTIFFSEWSLSTWPFTLSKSQRGKCPALDRFCGVSFLKHSGQNISLRYDLRPSSVRQYTFTQSLLNSAEFWNTRRCTSRFYNYNFKIYFCKTFWSYWSVYFCNPLLYFTILNFRCVVNGWFWSCRQQEKNFIRKR